MKPIFKTEIFILLFILIFVFSDPVSFLPSFLQGNKFADNLLIPEAKAAAQTFYMKTTNAALPYPATSDLYETTAGASSNVATFAQNKKTSGFYQFQPGITNATSWGTTAASLPIAPSNYGWLYTGTALDGMQTDAGNWTVNFKYSVVYSTAPTTKIIWYRIIKVSCSAGACSTVSVVSSTDAAAPAGSGWAKYALGVLPASGVLSAMQTVTSTAPAISWATGEKAYIEFAIQTNSTGSTTGGWKLESGTVSDSLVTPNASIPVNQPPALAISQPDGVGDTVYAGDPYNITYSLSDAEDIVTAAFYYDTNNSGLDGTAIAGACASAAEGAGVTCSWDTTGMAPGSYYVYGIATDGVNPSVNGYSPGMITINAAGPDATSVTYQVGGDGARSGYGATISGTNFGTVAGGNRANCAGGAGTGCVRFIIGGNATVADADITSWSNTSITFTINLSLSTYGGLASLQVVSASNADATPLTFYIYPNITSASASGQIGSTVTVSGDHFGASAGSITVNTKIATIGTWGETSLLSVKIPGQEGAINISGKILLTRSDGKASNQYPSAGSFTILAPSISGSAPGSATTGQTLTIEFAGLGIDTDTGIAPTLKLTKTGQTDIASTSYLKVADYQTVSASFDLTGAATGYWKLVIINMDGQSGSFGDEISTGFNISPLAPTVTGINPGSGQDSGITNIASVTGANFQNGAAVKLTKTAEANITPSTVFTFTNATALSSGAFDLTGKTNGWWNVVVANPDLQTASYGNEIDSGFEIKSAKPSLPANIYQFKTNTDSAQPPTANISASGGIGGQVAVYFRMDMAGGITGENYFPQVEAKPVGAAFECGNASPTPCAVTGGSFAEGSGVLFNGTAVQGWVNINGIDSVSYHWQARVRNSGGTSNWVSFGGNNDPNDIDLYIDNTPPIISLGIDNTCTTAAPAGSVMDLSAIIQWNTSDNMSGAASVFPGSGAYAKVQVDYKKGIESWTTTTLSSWENSMHEVALSGLSPATAYTFRVRSQDYLGNESVSSECGFTTASSRPIKTVEFFIGQEADSYKNLLPDGTSKKYFTIKLPESPASAISVKSAFIEITGVTSAAISQTVNVGLLRGDQTLVSGPAGENYALNSDNTTTPFTILFNALNPSGTGQESLANITTGAMPYDYTLFLKGDGVTDIWLFSAKLVITYSYEL